MGEEIPNEERMIEQSAVIELLRTRGIDDPEVKEFVLKWTTQQETLATEAGTARASITFNISRSELYLAVGDKDGALQALEDARVQAHQEGEIELYNQIMIKMDEVEEK